MGNPNRTPDGYKRVSGDDVPYPAIVVAGYTGYLATAGIPLSKGALVDDAVAGGTFDVFVQGFGFENASASFDLIPIGPGLPATPATIQSVTPQGDPSGATPGAAQVTIELAGVPAESIGQYALVMTNGRGNQDLVNVTIIAAV